MSGPIIRVQGVSKRYVLSHQNGKANSFRDALSNNFKKLASWTSKKNSNDGSFASREEFWALKDVSFDIQQGDRVGVIGRNGAGKSTLLKILSRITEPTTGSISINGRVASLLEVGTGFHPELTGRENIFLNGAILGMSRWEIKAKFDDIVSFAEVEKFLDTPVKRYSSGMYVRLAFAVAAHLEPEILVVDEVLAVGDTQFQKKCLGKMEDVSKNEGRTVLFVSHSMGTILQLCNLGILLDQGKILINDEINSVVDHYMNQSRSVKRIIRKQIAKEVIQFKEVFMTDKNEETRSEYRYDEEIFVRIELYIPRMHNSLELAMRLVDRHQRAVFTIHEPLKKYYNSHQEIKLNIVIPNDLITPGNYSWVMCINHPGISLYDLQQDIAPFIILETGSEFARYEGADYGCIFAKYTVQNLK